MVAVDLLHIEFAHELNGLSRDNLARNQDREAGGIGNHEVCRYRVAALHQVIYLLAVQLHVCGVILVIGKKEGCAHVAFVSLAPRIVAEGVMEAAKVWKVGHIGDEAFDARVKSLITDVPELPNFSRFHDAFRDNPRSKTNEGDMRTPFFLAYEEDNCTHVKLNSKEIYDLVRRGQAVSANFVIPYPPGFPILVPGQVITVETIEFMRKLDVKEIHGYHAASGLKLIKLEKLGGAKKKVRK